MDEFEYSTYGNPGEALNANKTWWKYQDCWWNMYTLVDNIQSNYSYILNENGQWENPAAQLVEGNYFIMFPQNTLATNRRDLWHYINPVDTLEAYDNGKPNYYVGRDNQFFLDYQQIYRDDTPSDETGKFQLDVYLKPVLSYAKLTIENQTSSRLKVEKIVFKNKAGQPLPTIAYVKPRDLKVAATDDVRKDECDNVLAEGLFDHNAFWTQDVARSIVDYRSTTDGYIPYGLTDDQATPAYEYSFIYPEAVELYSNRDADQSKTVTTVSIALPAFKGWQDMEVVVYGQIWDQSINDGIGAWRPGIIKNMKDKDNQVFTLDKLALWKQGEDIPVAVARIDDQSFYQMEEIRVATTADLISLLQARLKAASTNSDIAFEVHPYGNGLEITDEVVALIENYKKQTGRSVTVTFKRDLTQGTTPVILKAENCINLFKYDGVNVVVEEDQTVDPAISGIQNLANFATLTINADLTVSAGITNDKTATIKVNDAIVTAPWFHNDGKLYLNDNATVLGEVENNLWLEVTGGVRVVGTIYNLNDCINCGKTEATIFVNENATLVVETLSNNEKNGVVGNNGTINANKFINENRVENATKGTINAQLTNSGELNNHGLVTLYSRNGGLSVNTGDAVINNYADGEIRVGRDAAVANQTLYWLNAGTIYNHGIIMDVMNNGLIYQYKADEAKLYITNGTGTINVTGCTAGETLKEVVVQGQDKQTYVYDVTSNMKTGQLAGTNVLNIINVTNATLTIAANALPEWAEVNMEGATLSFSAKYTTPNNVNVNVNKGDNTFTGVGANFTEGALKVNGLNTHATIQVGCTMKFKDAAVDGDLKAFGELVLENRMTGLGYYNGNKIQY